MHEGWYMEVMPWTSKFRITTIGRGNTLGVVDMLHSFWWSMFSLQMCLHSHSTLKAYSISYHIDTCKMKMQFSQFLSDRCEHGINQKVLKRIFQIWMEIEVLIEDSYSFGSVIHFNGSATMYKYIYITYCNPNYWEEYNLLLAIVAHGFFKVRRPMHCNQYKGASRSLFKLTASLRKLNCGSCINTISN